jgi:hypothetical protein
MDRGLEFASGHQLDPESAGEIPANMIGRFLDNGDLHKLHWMLIKKKPGTMSATANGHETQSGHIMTSRRC